MNSLSWLLYLADIAGSASGLLGMLAFFGGGTAIVCSVIWVSTSGEPYIDSFSDREAREARLAAHNAFRAKVAGFIRPALYAFLGCALASSVIPSRETVYAIAASEMGEEVVKSETAGKAMKALNAWLDRQIAPEKAD